MLRRQLLVGGAALAGAPALLASGALAGQRHFATDQATLGQDPAAGGQQPPKPKQPGLPQPAPKQPFPGAPAPVPTQGRFKLKYAPHFGMFRHHAGDDVVNQLKFMADEGFTALEDNGLPGRSVQDQERIGRALQDLRMEMGVFVAHGDFSAPTFALPPEKARERVRADMTKAVEVAQRVGARWCTVVPGCSSDRTPLEYQMANVIDNLRVAAEILEPAGLVAVLEPLNAWVDHPGLFLTGIPQAYLVCRAVNSPSVKILDDLYHQQITEGHLIRNLDAAWSEIAYLQVGDNPGRREPGTGEINYLNLFRHVHQKGFTGIVGMEHGNAKPGKEGERAVIDAYVAADRF
jgi:hydroxypyruvate isomerase